MELSQKPVLYSLITQLFHFICQLHGQALNMAQVESELNYSKPIISFMGVQNAKFNLALMILNLTTHDDAGVINDDRGDDGCEDGRGRDDGQSPSVSLY